MTSLEPPVVHRLGDNNTLYSNFLISADGVRYDYLHYFTNAGRHPPLKCCIPWGRLIEKRSFDKSSKEAPLLTNHLIHVAQLVRKDISLAESWFHHSDICPGHYLLREKADNSVAPFLPMLLDRHATLSPKVSRKPWEVKLAILILQYIYMKSSLLLRPNP